MKDLVLAQDLVFVDQNEIYTDSLIVAREFGKRHDHVLRSIHEILRNYADLEGLPKFGVADYIDQQGKPRVKYNLSKDALMLLVMGYSTKRAMEIKIKYIQEFNRMQRYIQLKEDRVKIERKEEISIKNGSASGRGLYDRKIEKKENKEALSEIDRELATFGIFELIPPKTTIH